MVSVPRGRPGGAAVGGHGVVDRVERALLRRRVPGDRDGPVAADGDVGVLDVVLAGGQQLRLGERGAVVGGADHVDVRAAVAGEPGPGEVDVAAGRRVVRPVGRDRGLVVEDADEVRRGGAAGDDDRPAELLAVVDRRAAHSCWVLVGGDPHVAERLLRSGRVVGALRPGEQPAVAVPGEDGVAGARGADLRPGSVRRGVPGVSRNQRGLERCAAVLGPVVAQPDRPDRQRRTVGVRAVVVGPAVVVRAAHDHLRVARVDRDRGLVLPAPGAGALGEGGVGVGLPGHGRVVRDVPRRTRRIVGQPGVRAWIRRTGRAQQRT